MNWNLRIMKKTCFILLNILTLIVFKKAEAQSKPIADTIKHYVIYTYSFNYGSMKPMAYKPAKYKKDRVYINITNINRLLFDVSSSAQISSISQVVVNYFDTISKLTNAPPVNVAKVDANAMQDTYKYSYSTSTCKPDIVTIIGLQNAIVDDYKILSGNLQNLKEFSNFVKMIPVIASGEKYSQAAILQRLFTEPSVKALNTNNSFPNFDALISFVNSKPAEYTEAVKNAAESITKNKKKADELIEKVKQQCGTSGLSDLIKEFPADLDEVLTNAGKIDQPSLINAVSSVLNLLNKINDSTNFSYHSQEFIPDGDYMNLKALITPKDTYKDLYKPDSITLEIPVNGKFEWSVGPAINFSLSHSLFNDSYNIDTARNAAGVAKTDTFTVKKNKNQNTVIPSIGVMANFYWQHHSTLTPGISIGLSTAATDLSQLRVYLGGSLFIGGLATNNSSLVYNKVIINAGLAYGQVDRLKSNLSIGENPKSQIPYTGNNIAADQLTQKVGKVGLYVGVSYKLN